MVPTTAVMSHAVASLTIVDAGARRPTVRGLNTTRADPASEEPHIRRRGDEEAIVWKASGPQSAQDTPTACATWSPTLRDMAKPGTSASGSQTRGAR